MTYDHDDNKSKAFNNYIFIEAQNNNYWCNFI